MMTLDMLFFFFFKQKTAYEMLRILVVKQKTAYEMLRSLVGSEMCIRDSPVAVAGPESGIELTIPFDASALAKGERPVLVYRGAGSDWQEVPAAVDASSGEAWLENASPDDASTAAGTSCQSEPAPR